MPNAAIRATAADNTSKLRTQNLGTVNLTTHPHHIDNVGTFVLITLDERGAKYILNLKPEKARLMAACLVAAACEAEALERKARERAERPRRRCTHEAPSNLSPAHRQGADRMPVPWS